MSAFELSGGDVVLEKSKKAQMRGGDARAGLRHVAAVASWQVLNLNSGLFMKPVVRYKLLFMAAPEEIHHSRVNARSE